MSGAQHTGNAFASVRSLGKDSSIIKTRVAKSAPTVYLICARNRLTAGQGELHNRNLCGECGANGKDSTIIQTRVAKAPPTVYLMCVRKLLTVKVPVVYEKCTWNFQPPAKGRSITRAHDKLATSAARHKDTSHQETVVGDGRITSMRAYGD